MGQMTGGIPVYLKTRDGGEPSDPTYYLLAANGVFFVKKTRLFRSVTEAVVVAGLEQQLLSLDLAFPKLPRHLLERIWGFFQFVYDRLDGEAIVFIYYSPAQGEFYVDAPPQTLTRHRTRHGLLTQGNVEYRSIPHPEGFLKLGDAHSHGNSAAFFSSTDDRDDSEDGLRVVMGKLGRPEPDVCVSFVANGTRFRLESGTVLEDFQKPLPPPEAWIQRVTCRYEDRLGFGASGCGIDRHEH
jgi:hypothetical protein